MTQPPAAPMERSAPLTVSWHRRGDDVEVALERVAGDPDDPISDRDRDAASTQVRLALADPGMTGAEIHLAAGHPAGHDDRLVDAVADEAGFTHRRDLHQMRRTLPVEADHPARSGPTVSTRAFRPGTDDEAAWIRVNNRAFAGHPDQGHETPDTLADRMAEPWFDPAGFRIADDRGRPGELSGFCWTKVHPATDTDPELGEIYVIAVDPAHRGEGLGPAFVLAGLDHLASVGVAQASLYVDESNTGARRLYDSLGFTVHERRRVYRP